MSQKRAEGRDITIPPPKNPARRAACEGDPYEFLRTYFPHKFTGPFTDDRKDMIEAILRAAEFGRDQAIAAPRGEGKTTIAEIVGGIYCLLTGILKFPLIVASTGPDAERILANIKMEYETNDLLAEDFPEVCVPIRALEGAPQRCNMQTVNGGHRTRMKWGGKFIVLPDVPGSKASGAVLMTRGLDGAIRGIRYGEKRPDLVIIDDPETRESAGSVTQTRDRTLTIEQDIAGLGAPGKRISRVMLTTIMNRRCLSWEYTDPRKKPWNGKRYRLLVRKPEREDMWEEYMRLRQEGKASGEDRDGRAAMAYYLKNREEMDRGAHVSNPERYIQDPSEDGTPIEVSALQHCYNLIADRNWENFATEYQNDPPEEEGPETSGLTALIVESRISGLPRRVLPFGVVEVTAAIDVGKYACHWVVIAWLPGAIGMVVDHGVTEVYGTGVGDDRETVEKAILNALLRWRHDLQAEAYCDPNGEVHEIGLALVDSGDYTDGVYEFVRQVGGTPFCASKGINNWRPGTETATHIVGNHWYINHQPQHGIWLYGLDTDYWKRWTHDRFLTPTFDDEQEGRPYRAGSLSLWATPPAPPGQVTRRPHQSYAKHIVAEEWREIFVKGKGMVKGWHKENKNNHWLDATYMACAAADMRGIKLLASELPPPPENKPSQPPAPRFTTPSGLPYLITER